MARAQAGFEIGDVTVAPGTRRSLDLPLPALYSHAPLSMPVHVIHGRRSGPRLFVSAAIHGDEINGVEVIRRLFNRKGLAKLKGTLVLVPVVNVFGFINQSRYLPDRRDLNRAFPGSDHGSMASRLAHIFMQEVVSRCTHGIDIHTGAIGRENLPQIRANVNEVEETAALARAFGAPVIINSELRDGSLREAASHNKMPILLYECGEALRFDEASIRAGVTGVLHVMRYLDMLPKRKSRKPPANQLIAKSSTWSRAPQSGIWRSVVPMGEVVQKSQIIGWVSDPFGEKDAAVEATATGIVIGKSNLPLVHEGEALVHIARYARPKAMGEAVDAFQEAHDPLLDDADPPEPAVY